MLARNAHSDSRTARQFRLTFAYGRGTRSFSIQPTIFYIVVGVIPVLGLWYLFATIYLIFRDDMLASLMSRQTEMQYAYEDRISTLHGQLDQLTSRRLTEEKTLASKMEDIASRQVRLERRSAIVSSLAERMLPRATAAFGGLPGAPSALPAAALASEAKASDPHRGPSPNPLLNGAFSTGGGLPPAVSAFAPVDNPQPQAAAPAKPHPESFDLRRSQDADFGAAPSVEKSTDLRSFGDGDMAIEHVAAALDHIETSQDRILARLQTPLLGEMTRFRTILAEAGLSPDRLSLRHTTAAAPHKANDVTAKSQPSALGGPFVPARLDPDQSAFDREAGSLQEAILAVEQLHRTISSVPLRKPLPGDPDVTSSFGTRMDPFFGRLAMHTGIDLREDYGADVHATASGKVTIAGAEGGYGNMVEIDHGNGLATRYAHLSAITIADGQWVEAGQVVGRIGMTGRTTGPHLHYETRIDGEPVDPLRFLKAGARLFSHQPSALAEAQP